jgi:hypothetical protein
MPPPSRPFLRRIASRLMLLAMAAFVQQAAMIGASQARASAGIMPAPAIPLSGAVHVHDGLAGHVHVHGGTNVAGHVHSAVDPDDDDDADGTDHPPMWSLGCTSAVIPVIGVSAVVFEAVRVGECRHQRGEGVEPAGLNRPPSTPSIA